MVPYPTTEELEAFAQTARELSAKAGAISKLDRAHLDALPTILQPLIAGKHGGLTSSQCSAALYEWDQARRVS